MADVVAERVVGLVGVIENVPRLVAGMGPPAAREAIVAALGHALVDGTRRLAELAAFNGPRPINNR